MVGKVYKGSLLRKHKMVGNLLKIKKRFVENVCIDILIVIACFIILILWVALCMAITEVFYNFMYVLILIIIISALIFLYSWIKSTWKQSREEIENE